MISQEEDVQAEPGRNTFMSAICELDLCYILTDDAPITFTDGDFKALDLAQDDHMAIMIDIESFAIMKTLVY